eukprot:4416538-Prymnesium_polylepis.3
MHALVALRITARAIHIKENASCCMRVQRGEDEVLMALIQLSLILIYICVLLIKACNDFAASCSTFGFVDANGVTASLPLVSCRFPGVGTSSPCAAPSLPPFPAGPLQVSEPFPYPMICFQVYLFFIFFGFSTLAFLAIVTVTKLYVSPRGFEPRYFAPSCRLNGARIIPATL